MCHFSNQICHSALHNFLRSDFTTTKLVYLMIFRKQLSEALSNDVSIVVAVIDSIFYKMGFLGFKPYSIGNIIDQVRNDNTSLYYTPPEIETQTDYVVLKFENLDKNLINVSGSLVDRGIGSTTEVYALPLKREFFRRPIEEGEMIEIRNIVKDNLALPLLIDLCEKAGFVLPPCFSGLPGDLKLKIMEFLPGNDVARLSCVSTELRDLGLTEDLWKMKFVHEFGDVISKQERMSTWRTTYRHYWERSRKPKFEFFPFFKPKFEDTYINRIDFYDDSLTFGSVTCKRELFSGWTL